jgi:hypothetical protein
MAFEPGDWKIGIGDGRLAIEQRAQRIVRGAEFDAGDVAQPDDRAIGCRS